MSITTNPENVTSNTTVIAKAARAIAPVNKGLAFLAPIADLLVRLAVARDFFQSGLTKIKTFDSTILLFQYEYEVPFLSPTVAAYLGTAAELLLPVFLALGLAGRYAAIGLFFFNIVAVISYPPAQEGAGFVQHQIWGILLLVTICYGPGKISIDHLINRFVQK